MHVSHYGVSWIILVTLEFSADMLTKGVTIEKLKLCSTSVGLLT